MAGKKQHFIPRHFLKPFVIPSRGDHLWMYRKGQSSAIPVARNDAAAQSYFYSKPSGKGLPTLDDLVTEYEGQLHSTVDQIRTLKPGEVIEGSEIATVIAHLMVRSSHIRGTMKEAIVAISDSVQELLCDGSDTSLINLPRHDPPERVYRMILEELDKLGLTKTTPVTERTIVDLLYLAMRERGSEVLDEVLPILAETLEGLRADAKEMGRRAQVSALKEMMAPQGRVAELEKLTWRVLPASDGGAILPDCTSIAFNGREWQPLLLTGTEEMEAVVLALAPDRMAVGTTNTELDVDLSQYNRHAAQASYSFFLANHNSARLTEFIEQLGEKVRTSFEMMTNKAVVEAFGDMFRDKDDEDRLKEKEYASARSWKTAAGDEAHKYFVSFEGFGDEEFAKSVANEVGSVVSAFPRFLPTSSLEEFKFTTKYEAALNRPDRGTEPFEEIVLGKSEEIVGVGMPVHIVSNGTLKTRVFLRATVAAALVSEDSVLAEEARNVILHMLASSALRALIAHKFPNQESRPVDDPFEALLHQYTSGVFESYFCASLSTGNEEQIKRREELALTAVRRTLDEIPARRRAYVSGGDLEDFFGGSAIVTANLLSFLAALFGAYKGSGQAIPRSNAVLVLLAEHGLGGWADLFRADLEAFDAGLEQWADFREMFFVHRHFQRFLANFGIVPDRHDGPGAYVHVPWIPSDGNSLRGFGMEQADVERLRDNIAE